MEVKRGFAGREAILPGSKRGHALPAVFSPLLRCVLHLLKRGACGLIGRDYPSESSACKNGACCSYDDGDEEDVWWEDVFGRAAKVTDLQLPEAAVANQKKLQQELLAKERPPLKSCASSPLRPSKACPANVISFDSSTFY